MKIEEAITFLTIEPPKNEQKHLMIYPNLGIATYQFDEKIRELTEKGVKFVVNYSNFTLKGQSIGTIIFASAEHPGRLKNETFTSVYVHPTIKEIMI